MMNEVKENYTLDLYSEIAKLQVTKTDLLEALEGFLKLHATFMADAGFNPPVCECELCVAGRKAKSHTDTLKRD